MGDSRELFRLLFDILYYLSIPCTIAIVVAAFVRFKTTPAAFLIAGGFGGGLLVSIFFRILKVILKAVGTGEAGTALFVGRSMLQLLLMLVVGVGVILIPSSLEKLTKRT